jgi:uncharacterized protein YfaP (DUF2135 family)
VLGWIYESKNGVDTRTSSLQLLSISGLSLPGGEWNVPGQAVAQMMGEIAGDDGGTAEEQAAQEREDEEDEDEDDSQPGTRTPTVPPTRTLRPPASTPTGTVVTPAQTPTTTSTRQATSTLTSTATAPAPTATATASPTSTSSPTGTATESPTATATATTTTTSTPTTTSTLTPTSTATPTITATSTPTATETPGTATLSGTVADATNSQPIDGALVEVVGTGLSTITQNGGQFTIQNVPIGAQSVRTTAAGYVINTRAVTVTADPNPALSISLSPIGTDITIVLTWGSQPLDLDSHLSGPSDQQGGRFHIYFANKDVGYASLDVDDTNGNGPETTTISPGHASFQPGEYRFWVHNFSTSPEFDVSNANVTVNQNASQLASYDVDDASGDPADDIWFVVTLQIDEFGQVTLTTVQQFQAGGSATPLSTDGSGPVAPEKKTPVAIPPR